MRKGILLYGGGLDSTAVLMHLANEPDLELTALHIDYGQVAFKREQDACLFWCGKYAVPYATVEMDLRRVCPDTSIVGGIGPDVMDGRNIVLMSVAAMWAVARNISTIYVGFHAEPPGHPFPDATEVSVDIMQLVFDNLLLGDVQVEAPFLDEERVDIAARAFKKDPQFFSHTHTCYANVKGGCGTCAHCVKKAEFEKQVRG